MRKTRNIAQRIQGQNQRAKKAGARHDLTLEQWQETLEYFNYKCAYCGKREYEFIEHYLSVSVAGTTASNCVPACASCNVQKDVQGHTLIFYQNKRVLSFLESKGVKIKFHIHEYMAIKTDHVILVCESCGDKQNVPGLAYEEAQAYIEEHFQNKGFAYII